MLKKITKLHSVRKLAGSAGNVTLLEHGLYAALLHVSLFPVLFDTGITRMVLLGAGLWDTRGHALLLNLHPLANGWKEDAITSTCPSCHHLIKPHGVGVKLTGWGLLANLMRATRWGPWRMDYRRLHGAKERDIHIGVYYIPLRPAFLAFPCVQLP